MSKTPFRRALGSLLVAALAAGPVFAAETRPTTNSGKAPASSSQRPTTTRSGSTARGPLPDPVLLDGSKEKAEKKSEYGMIGDFELPGDENVRDGKVGGQQGGAGGQQNPGQTPQSNGIALPQLGGGSEQAKQASAGGKQGEENSQGGGGKDSKNAGNQPGGPGDPNAKPEGQQVAQLGGEGQQPPGGAGEKPSPVAIGDSAMRIQTSPAAAGVVGAQQQVQGNTQHHEKGTGSGGRPPTGTQGNNRVEKGRVIPSGL